MTERLPMEVNEIVSFGDDPTRYRVVEYQDCDGINAWRLIALDLAPEPTAESETESEWDE